MSFKLYDFTINELLKENSELSYLYYEKNDLLTLFVTLGDKLYFDGKINGAYYCFCKAYDNFDKCQDSLKAKISICLSTLALKLNKIDKARKVLSNINRSDLKISQKQESKLLFNHILVLKAQGNLNEALENILLYESKYSITNTNFFNLISLKANILKEKGLLQNAVSIYELLISSCDKLENKVVALCNILNIYIDSQDIEKIYECLATLKNLLEEYKNYTSKCYEAEIYYAVFRGYRLISDDINAKIFYKLAYDSALNISDFNILDKCIKTSDAL